MATEKRGLYSAANQEAMAMLWVLNFSDGTHSLLEIADRAQLPFADLASAAAKLSRAGLLEALD